MQSQENSPIDKKTVLAFALMFVVWFGWMALFPQKRPAPEQASSPTEMAAETTPAPESGAPSPALVESSTGRPEVSTGWASLAGSETGEPIRVRTPNFEAEIDPVGGDLLSWRLTRYEHAEGGPVELVGRRTTDLGRQRAHGLRLVLEDRALDLRDVSFEPSTAELSLSEDDGPRELVLRASRGDTGELDLIYRFWPDRYGFDVVAEMRPPAGERAPVGLEISWPAGIATTEADSVDERRESRAVARIGEEIHKVKFDDLRRGESSKGHRSYEGSVSWAGVQGKYFLAAVIDPEPQLGFVRLSGDGAAGVQTFQTHLAMRGTAPSQIRYSVYLGPVDYDRLGRYDKDPWNAQLTKLVDLGPSIFRPVASLTLSGLRLLHNVVPNWGWTIVIFSILTKLIFWPLTRSSTESMKRMQELQPKLKKLQEKYKNDQQTLSREMMALYRENKVNPVGGCLPLLIQMPVFYALFTILRKTIDLRQAEWMLWIDDLSRPDVLFHLPLSLPLFGDKFCLLPFLMAIGMWAQTKLSQSNNSAPAEGMMAQQMKMMGTLMPIMMFVLFYNSPSGLVLYWFINTVLTAAQTWRVHQKSATPALA